MYYVKHFNSSDTLQIEYFYSYVTHDKTEKFRNNLSYHGLLEVFRIWYWVFIIFGVFSALSFADQGMIAGAIFF